MTGRLARLGSVTESAPTRTVTTLAGRMRRRVLQTYAVVLPLFTLGIASPAFAAPHRSDGDDPGTGLNTLATIGLYVGIPLGIALLIALLTFAPASTRGPRYRPGGSWDADASWLGGPNEGARSAGGAHPEQGPQSSGAGGARGSW